jgi:2-methylcitrate dehydratase PrpD
VSAAVAPAGTGDAIAFVRELTWAAVPAVVKRQLAWALLDLLAVSVAGRPAPAARIAADHAQEAHGGDAATALLDGRRLSVPGAAWANGVLANVLDYDDGHRLTKGHPGAIVIPAALAAAEAADATLEELLTAIVVGYEIAIRAGVQQHARAPEYHASGSWGALGAAAAAGRLLGLDADGLRRAVGLAEYHAPISPIMRSVADPAMTKDATGWGAFVGTSGVLLARRGYTSLESGFLLEADVRDLGERWALLELYVKRYPCCRWTQPAIEASLALPGDRPLAPEAVRGVTIRTFAAADELARKQPATTEDAQYSLVWPVAAALARGRFGVEDVLGDFDDPGVAALADRTVVVVDPELTQAFPARRAAEVTVELTDGRTLASGLVEAPGDPGDPAWEAVVERKVRDHLAATSPAVRTTEPPDRRLGGLALDDLMQTLTYALGERR